MATAKRAFVVLFVLACMATLHTTDASCNPSNNNRHLLSQLTKPVIGPHPDEAATHIKVELSFSERRNKVVDSTVQGFYSHFLHEDEYTTSCLTQAAVGAGTKAKVDPKPEWRTRWAPETLQQLEMELKSTKSCDTPALSTSNDFFYNSRMDAGVMNDGTLDKVEFHQGSCQVALAMLHDEGAVAGCACHCFVGKALVSFQQRGRFGTQHEVLTCTDLEREPEMQCGCTPCTVAAA